MHFFKVAAHFILGAVLATGAISTPVPLTDGTGLSSRSQAFPFNGYGGFQSINGFDDFFGAENFIGNKNEKIFLPDQGSCRSSNNIGNIQQQLFVFQELIKKLILEEICEVEVQIIIIQQFTGGFQAFEQDLFRSNGQEPGFDREIAKFGSQLSFDAEGKFNIQDFGFNGGDIGKNIIIIINDNYDSDSSPQSIKNAFDISESAIQSSLQIEV
jgi:hypothetical protein